jgi:hypothetical protein
MWKIAPLGMLLVADLFLEDRLPPGAFNVVCGKGWLALDQ